MFEHLEHPTTASDNVREIAALRAEVERLQAALADAGEALDNAARGMIDGSLEDIHTLGAVSARRAAAEARAALDAARQEHNETS